MVFLHIFFSSYTFRHMSGSFQCGPTQNKPPAYGFISQQGKEIFLFSEPSSPALGPTQLPTQWVPVFIMSEYSSWGMKVTTQLHLVPRSVMNGPVPLLPPHTFMACTGTTLVLAK